MWNIPINVAPRNDEWQEMDMNETVGDDDRHGFASLNEGCEAIDEAENGGGSCQESTREGDNFSSSFNNTDSSQSYLRCEILRLKAQVTSLKR